MIVAPNCAFVTPLLSGKAIPSPIVGGQFFNTEKLMCGIVGSINFNKNTVSQSEIKKGLDTIAHRGPDAERVWCHQNIGLGHCRLSIIDTSEASNQPMTDTFGRVIVFNGEIYNFKALRKELEDDYIFRTKSDTEVILAAYNKWGANCTKYFNGDWAFVIYDQVKNHFFLSRDRFGIKPFYYHLSNGRFVFASEVKALFAMGVLARMSRETFLMLIKSARNEMGAETLYEGVNTIPPAHNMTISSDGEIKLSEYWGEKDLFENAPPYLSKKQRADLGNYSRIPFG